MDGGRARFKLAEYDAEAEGAGTEEADTRLEARFARRSCFSR